MDEAYRQHAREQIRRWENEGPGFLSQVGDFIMLPAQKLIEGLVPDAVQNAVAKALEGCLLGLRAMSGWTFNAAEVRSRVTRCAQDAGDELKASDEAAKHYWNWHIAYAVGEGAATGATGLPGLVANIPALFSISLRLIQEAGTCYGYDMSDDTEKEYVLHVLRTGATSDLKSKLNYLIALKQVEETLLKVTWKKMAADLAKAHIGAGSLLALLKQFARSLGMQITKRKALQMVPAIGALIGASFDGTFVNDIGRAAYMNYRRRWLAERDGPPPELSVTTSPPPVPV